MNALRPLIVIAILLAASGFTSDTLGEYIGPIDYKGYLVFDYPEGENPINNIVFTVDSTIADNLIILSVPSTWSYSYDSPVLTLSGGSVNPGGTVIVTVSLNKYFEEGEYAVSSIGTTTTSEFSQATGPLLVGNLPLLKFIGMTFDYRFPLAALVVILSLVELYISGRKKESTQDWDELFNELYLEGESFAISDDQEQVGECKEEYKVTESEINHDVKISKNWENSVKKKKAIENSIKGSVKYSSGSIGTTIAFSDGANVSGSSKVAARVYIKGGDQSFFSETEPLESKASGNTKITVRINAPQNAKTAISAATLTALEAESKVFKFDIETADRIEHVCTILDFIDEKSAMALEFFKTVVSNSNIKVVAEGETSFKVGSCQLSKGKIKAKTERKLNVTANQLVEPLGGFWYQYDTPAGLASCTEENDMIIDISSQIKVSGSAESSLGGSSSINSLWASCWVFACRIPTGEEEYVEKFGSRSVFDMRLMLPPDLTDHKTILSALKVHLENKLKELLSKANFPSPIDEPEKTEAALRDVLFNWMKYIEEKWNLFTEHYFDPPEND